MLSVNLVGILSRASPIFGIIDRGSNVLSACVTLPLTADKEHYTGTYDVSVSVSDDQVLPTRQKILSDDITVHKVYFSKTENPSGGATVYIG